MKRFPFLLWLALAFVMIPLLAPIAYAQDVPDAEELVVSSGGLEAIISVQACGTDRIVLVTWKNTNGSPVVAALTVKRKDSEDFLFAVSTSLGPQEVRPEGCGDIDMKTRSLGAMGLDAFEAILILPNN